MHWVDRQRTAPNSPAFERLLRDAAPPAAGAAASLPGISPAPAPALAPASAPLMGAATAQAAVSVSDAQPDPGGEAARREARHAAELRAAERRERAWALSYKKPALCDDNPNKAIMVECANDYIRARREFEEIRGVGPTRSLGPRGAP